MNPAGKARREQEVDHGAFQRDGSKDCLLWELITHSLRASKSSSPRGQRQWRKTWQPVEIIYSVKVDGSKINLGPLHSFTFYPGRVSGYSGWKWRDYILLALSNCPITLDQCNTLKLSKHRLHTQHSQMSPLAQILESNVNNKKELKKIGLMTTGDYFFCPITVLYWWTYQFMLDRLSSSYAMECYLLNGVVHVLPDLSGLSQLLLFQRRRGRYVSKLASPPQFCH